MTTFNLNNCFQKFKSDISGINLPEKFTFPFVYEPTEIALIASKELKEHIVSNKWNHNFDSNQPNLPPVGKMFGVLVVQSTNGELFCFERDPFIYSVFCVPNPSPVFLTST